MCLRKSSKWNTRIRETKQQKVIYKYMSDDPHYQREKEKYENPVASREYLMSVLKEHDKPLSFLDMRAMEREGQI